jgi:HD-GYP domain-containing protein (c-di-GMP phosphodiesterase class II)
MLAPSLQSLGYLPVSTVTLCEAKDLDFDLYIQYGGRSFAELYRGRSYPLTGADLEKLRADGVDHLYIRWDDKDSYRTFLKKHVLSDKCMPVAARTRALREVTRVAFEDALRRNNCEKMVHVAGDFGRDLAGMLADETPAFQELFKALDHDYYTFTHACNVSTYCALIAVRSGKCDVVELAEIAAGGILHDIGKRHIPVHILNKSRGLTDQEWELMRQHPITGYKELASRGDLSEGQLMMVRQHHERLDGSGYPDGVKGDKIHPWGKICAVADVFDALSSRRPYRGAVPLATVISYLQRFANTQFDAEAAHCLTGAFSDELAGRDTADT